MSMKPIKELAEAIFQKEISDAIVVTEYGLPKIIHELRFKTDSGRSLSLREILNSLRYETIDATWNFQALRAAKIEQYSERLMEKAMEEVVKENRELRFTEEHRARIKRNEDNY